MTTKLTPRQAVDHLFLLTLIGGAHAKRGNVFKLLEESLQAQPETDRTYNVEVRVNGIELDFADFTDEVQRQLDDMVMRAARKVFDEHVADKLREITDQIYTAERATKDLRRTLESKVREAWGLPPDPEED